MLSLLVAFALSACEPAASPGLTPGVYEGAARDAPLAHGEGRGRANDEYGYGSRDGLDEDEAPPRLRLIFWGGEGLASGGSGRSSPLFGGEAGWAFGTLDLGIAASSYRKLEDSAREWTPVLLARLTQRFETGRGMEAAFGLGLGAGRPRSWTPWFQVALGMRAAAGPFFLAGELAFEQRNILRLAAGLGVAFF